jgi:hypothetical protein
MVSRFLNVNSDVVTLTAAETRHAVELTVASTGFSKEDLQEQGLSGHFKSEKARRAWRAVTDVITPGS